nr:MAG TPA: hypothetical protein [Caudoviricetes sp.]
MSNKDQNQNNCPEEVVVDNTNPMAATVIGVATGVLAVLAAKVVTTIFLGGDNDE